jgi:hypothetical protein
LFTLRCHGKISTSTSNRQLGCLLTSSYVQHARDARRYSGHSIKDQSYVGAEANGWATITCADNREHRERAEDEGHAGGPRFLEESFAEWKTGISAAVGGGVSLTNRPTPRHNMRVFKQYNHSGKYRRVPSTWEFPTLPLQNMYVYWHCGDEEKGIPPLKYLEHSDIDFISRGKKALSEIKSVMQFIDKQAISAGITPKDLMTQIEANSCYHHTEAGNKQLVPTQTPQGRPRDFRKLKVSYVVKFVRHHS